MMEIEEIQAIALEYGLDDVRIRHNSFSHKMEMVLSDRDYHHLIELPYDKFNEDGIRLCCKEARESIDKLKDGE